MIYHPLFKITILALICSISLAGIYSDVAGPEYNNMMIDPEHLCDHTKPSEFPQAYKSNFNCTTFAVLNNGNYVCNDDPCAYIHVSGPWEWCVWQTESFGLKIPAFFESGGPHYDLKPCYRCPTADCHGRYSFGKRCPGGFLKTKDYGETWFCQADSCNSETRQMKIQPDGTYACVDPSCAGVVAFDEDKGQWKCPVESRSVSSFIPWVIVALLSVVVLYLARQIRTQEKPKQESDFLEN